MTSCVTNLCAHIGTSKNNCSAYDVNIVGVLFRRTVVIDLEKIDYYATPYVRLAEKGIFLHKLRGSYAIPRQPWKVDVLLTYPSSMDLVKTAIREFLTSEYLGENIVFLHRRSDRENQFYVQFDRRDM